MLLSISTLGSCWLHDILSSRCCHFPQRCSQNLESWLTLQPATENADYSGMVSALKVTLMGEIASGQAQASATSGNREAFSFLTLICSASCSFCLGRCRSHAPAILARKLRIVRAGRACTVLLSSESCLSHQHWSPGWGRHPQCSGLQNWVTIPNSAGISIDYLIKHSLTKIILIIFYAHCSYPNCQWRNWYTKFLIISPQPTAKT